MQSSKKYFSSPKASAPSIDNLIEPIINKVKRQNITSYFQLRHIDQLQGNIFNPFTRRKELLPNVKKKMNKTLDSRFAKHQNNQVSPYITEKLLSPQNKTIKNYWKRKELLKNFSDSSKIKKHLVEDIDFDEIQRIFYTKKEGQTKYDYFFSKIKTKPRPTNSDAKIQFSKTQGKFKGSKQEFNPESLNLEGALRSTQRKKFWMRERSPITNKHEQKIIHSERKIKIMNL